MLYITTRLTALLGEGAKLVVVFDGDRNYAAKEATQERRRVNTEKAKANAGPTSSAAYLKASAAPQEELQKQSRTGGSTLRWRSHQRSRQLVPRNTTPQCNQMQSP